MAARDELALRPITFRPILKERVWGGRRLADLGFALPPHVMVGEAWVLADLPPGVADGQSIIEEGPPGWEGRRLGELLAAHPQALLGGSLHADGPAEGRRFPLLVKLLDARESLSVQVHPTPAYARRHPGCHVKCEAWVVLEAAPGAVIYKGLRPGVDEGALRRHIAQGTVEEALVAVPAEAGACHYLPSGICHALGGGVLVAEVQTPSDTTFRVFDWQRRGRELHVEEALECIFDGSAADPAEAGAAPPIEAHAFRTTRLAATPHFRIERIEVLGASQAELPVVATDVPVVWLPLEIPQPAELSGPGSPVRLRPGHAVLLPPGLEGWGAELPRGVSLLRIEPTGRLDRTIAQAT